MRRLIAALACALGLPGAALADCAAAARAGWSAETAALWSALTAGETAAPAGDADLAPFLRDVLGCTALMAALPPQGLVLTGARVSSIALAHAVVPTRVVCRDCNIGRIDAPHSQWRGGLDLGGSGIGGPVDLTLARIAGDLDLSGIRAMQPGDPSGARIALSRATIDGNLSLDGGLIAGAVEIEAARIGGSLAMRRAAMISLTLEDARIGGRATLDGSLLAGGLRLHHLTAAGTVSLREVELSGPLAGPAAAIGGALRLDGAVLPRIALEGASIGEHMVLSGARVAGGVDLDKASIGGDLWIRQYENGPDPVIGAALGAGAEALTMRNAELGGRIDISGARFGGGISFDAVRIGEDLWLRRGSSVAGPIVAVFARIGQNLDLSGATLGDLTATGARIGGELRLGAPGNDTLPPPVWREGARLDLRNASAAAVVDTVAATGATAAGDAGPGGTPGCPPLAAPGDPWPAEMDVTGFSYARFGGLGGGDEVTRVRCGWYVAWLARQQPFSLDPYRRLADHLDAEGKADPARSVRWAAKERQLERATGLEWVRLFLQKIFVGYGIFSYTVFLWMAGFAALGALIFPRAPEAKTSPVPLGFVFSLDMLLPFLSFRRAHGDVDLQGPVRFYLYFHKFMGWVFALFFASALGGLFAV